MLQHDTSKMYHETNDTMKIRSLRIHNKKKNNNIYLQNLIELNYYQEKILYKKRSYDVPSKFSNTFPNKRKKYIYNRENKEGRENP